MDRSKITFGGITMPDEVKAVLLGIPTAEGVLIRLGLINEGGGLPLFITFQQHIPSKQFSPELLGKIEGAQLGESVEAVFDALMASQDLIEPVTTQLLIGPLGEELLIAAKIAGTSCLASEKTGAWRRFFKVN